MRQACNECHSAKIRCSGDRTGCSRCLRSGLTCEYAVSMVGRMSKSNRQRKTNSERQNVVATTEQASTVNNSIFPPLLSGDSFSNLASFGLQDYDNFNSDAFLGNFDLWALMESANKTTAVGASELESTQLNMNFNIDQYEMFPTDTNAAVPLLAGTSPPSLDSISTSCNNPDGSQGSRSSDELKMKAQYPYLYALSDMIAFLESFVTNNEAAIDEVLRINRAYIAEITNIMELEQYKRCNSCPMLVLTAMELILALYENAIFPGARRRKDSSYTPSSHPSIPANNLPNLQFGVFMMDPQEKIALGNRVICKELQRYTQVIKELGSERQKRADNLSFGIVHVRWLVELESRVEAFIKALKD